MPSRKRNWTDIPGVFFVEGKNRKTKKPTKCFYIKYTRPDGKIIEEKAGFAHTGMSPYQASQIRADRIRGKEPSNAERRAAKAAEAERWTIDKLWQEYKANKSIKGIATDESRYKKFIQPELGKLEPHLIDQLKVARIRSRMLKTLKPQTVKNTLELLHRIVNFGINARLSDPLPFKIESPKCNNIVTEDLSPDQLKALFQAIENDRHPIAGKMMLCALFTGMRRGEMFRLTWNDLDFEKRFIKITGPKGGIDQTIPMNDKALEVFNMLPRNSEYVFPGQDGGKRVDIKKPVNRIKREAELPDDFRPLHGLRHVYASILAISGEVDMYRLQKLLTHKSSDMTQRYAHLRDESLHRAGSVISKLFENVEIKKADIK